MIIESPDGQYTAKLIEVEDGVHVTMYKRRGRVKQQLSSAVFDRPFHVVCDAVADTLRRLGIAE